MNEAHAFAQDKYRQIKAQVLAEARHQLQAEKGALINVTHINDHAFVIAKQWESSPARHPDARWSWVNDVRRYKRADPAALDIAMWFSGVLCSLSIGKPTAHKNAMRMDVIEAAPYQSPLSQQVVATNLVIYQMYALAIGATQIRIMRPLNAKLVSYYQSYGYILRTGKASAHPTYLYRNL